MVRSRYLKPRVPEQREVAIDFGVDGSPRMKERRESQEFVMERGDQALATERRRTHTQQAGTLTESEDFYSTFPRSSCF
jgi:hypothetical protein